MVPVLQTWDNTVLEYVDVMVSMSKQYFVFLMFYRVAQKSKPLPNYQKIVLNSIKVCKWD